MAVIIADPHSTTARATSAHAMASTAAGGGRDSLWQPKPLAITLSKRDVGKAQDDMNYHVHRLLTNLFNGCSA